MSVADTTLLRARLETRVNRRAQFGILAVMVALGAAAMWLGNYQPLIHGSFSGVHGDHLGKWVGSPWTSPDRARVLGVNPGEGFSQVMTITNSGPLPVTITEIFDEYDFEERMGTYYPVRILVQPAGAEQYHPFAIYESFEPFSLGAGEERAVVIDFRFGDCNMDAGEWSSRDSVPVTYKTGPVESQTDIPLHNAIVTKGDKDHDCVPTN